jgi:hypothetical protein
MIELLAPGAHVLLHGEINATIRQVSISGANHHVQYEVVWLNGNARSTAWVESHEIEPRNDAEKMQVGFAAASHSNGATDSSVVKARNAYQQALADKTFADLLTATGQRHAIYGRSDKPFHKAECCCDQCLTWIHNNPIT